MMIVFNLLPHRDMSRKKRNQDFGVRCLLALGAGALVVASVYAGLMDISATQDERNEILAGEIKKLDGQIADVASLRGEIELLKSRQKAVEELQIERNSPVHLLTELALQAPEGVFLTSTKQEGSVLTIAGIAQSNERVSEFLRNTADHSAWFSKPELVVIKVGAPNVLKEGKRLFEFTVRVTMRKPQDVAEADGGVKPTTPQSAASAALALRAGDSASSPLAAASRADTALEGGAPGPFSDPAIARGLNVRAVGASAASLAAQVAASTPSAPVAPVASTAR